MDYFLIIKYTFLVIKSSLNFFFQILIFAHFTVLVFTIINKKLTMKVLLTLKYPHSQFQHSIDFIQTDITKIHWGSTQYPSKMTSLSMQDLPLPAISPDPHLFSEKINKHTLNFFQTPSQFRSNISAYVLIIIVLSYFPTAKSSPSAVT